MAQKYNEQYLTAQDAATLLGVSDRTIRTWAANPKRAIARNSRQNYGLISLLFACLEDAKGQEKDLNKARAELTIAQTKKTKVETEIKVLERDRIGEKLLDADEVAKVWQDHQFRIKGKLLNLPRKLPIDLAGELPPEVAQAISSEQRDTLLSKWQAVVNEEVYAILHELVETADEEDG